MELQEGLKPVSTCRSDLLNPRFDTLGRSLFISFHSLGLERESIYVAGTLGVSRKKTATTNQKYFFSRSTLGRL